MNEDLDFLQNKINEAPAALPDALSEETVASLVQSETQAKPKKRRYRTVIVSLAAALVLLIGVTLAVKLAGTRPRTFDQKPEQAAPAETQSYDAIGALLKKNQKKQESKNGFSGVIRKSAGDFYMAESDASMPATVANEAVSTDGSYSELNTRTEGVDEADTVRTDGRYIYVLSKAGMYGGYYPRFKGGYYYDYGYSYAGYAGEQTFTVILPGDGHMQKVSQTRLSPNAPEAKRVTEQRSFYGFYLYGSYAVLTGSETVYEKGALIYDTENNAWIFDDEDGDPDAYTYPETRTKGLVCIYDLSDPANVKLVKELRYDSSILDTRITDGRLITVSTYYPYRRDFKADDYSTFIPYAGDGYVAPADICVADEEGDAFFTVTVTDLSSAAFACESVSVLGTAYDFYCSGKNVYAYGDDSEYKGPVVGWVSKLVLYKISVEGDAPAYIAKTELKDAWLHDDYAIDEFGGNLRLALECWNGDERENYILVLDDALNALGQSQPFGKGEMIESVRFAENTCYAVTFYQTDPLFVFDLTDPANPTPRGELKLPGFSAYLHPAGEGYMVGVGQGGTDEGLDGSAKISLFSVADPENPVETDHIVLSEGWFNSDHKAFVPCGDNGFIVTYTLWNGNRCGALYFTVENGKLTEQSRAEIPVEDVDSAHRAMFIGSELYLYARYSGYADNAGEYDGYGSYRSGEAIWSYDLGSGEAIDHIEL